MPVNSCEYFTEKSIVEFKEQNLYMMTYFMEEIMIIRHNMMAMNTARELKINARKKAGTTEKLSSGYKSNRAADGSAELAISEKMRKLIRGLGQDHDNITEGISVFRSPMVLLVRLWKTLPLIMKQRIFRPGFHMIKS